MRGGLKEKDKLVKQQGYLSINDICKLLNKGRATVSTVIKYLNINGVSNIGSRPNYVFYTQDNFKLIESFYETHKDYSIFLAKEMRKLKNGGNGYTSERTNKILNTYKQKYGEDWKQEFNKRREKSIKEKYGDKNYRNKEKSNKTLIENRNKFAQENDYTEFTKIFNSNVEHSWKTLNYCLEKLNISLISYKTVLFIKNEDVDKLKNELEFQKKNWHTSNGEQEIYNFCNLYFNDIVKNDRSVISPKELDIYIPSRNVAIEFNGLHYHNELFVDKDYHLNKTIECENKNVRLIHIFEDEWLYKKDICKSIILSSCGIYERKIFARKCEIKELTTEEYRNFLNKNHLQGYTMSKYKIGLFYNNELVQCIGIGSSRFTKNEIELVRLCTKLNTQVIGGFSKLINYVCNTYNIKEIISYVDRRVFNGCGYKGANFEVIGYSKPSYQITKGLERFNRMTFQKKNLQKILKQYDESLTEHQNCLNNQYYRIYDCGTIKVKYTYKNN